MERDANALYSVLFRVQRNAKLFFHTLPAGEQQLGQFLHLLCGQLVAGQQNGFHAHGLHIRVLAGIRTCRQRDRTVGAVSARQTLGCRTVHIQQTDAALPGKLGQHRAGCACRDKDGIHLARFQLGGSILIVQVHGVHQLVVQAVGRQNLQDKIRETLAIAVDGYVLVDLQGFEKTIDMVGGVEFDIPTDLQYDDDDENIHVDLKAGRQLLDGAHALQLCRYRSGAADMDIERAATQQEFLRALARKLASSATLAKVKDYAELFATYVRTDLTVGNLIYLGSELMQCDFNAMYTVTLPGEAVEIKGGDYYQLDPDGVLKILKLLV